MCQIKKTKKLFMIKDMKLPLKVLYESGESWYLEQSQPIAIFLYQDKAAAYIRDLPKMPWREANKTCFDMDIGNLYWQIPNKKQLQLLLDYREELNQTLQALDIPLLREKKYWGRDKIGFDMRVGVDLSLEREIYIEECQYAFTRPFLRLGS